MSPRSAEFMAEARERLAGAADALTSGHPGLAASGAYYAMLYAAKPASAAQARELIDTARRFLNEVERMLAE